MSRRVAVAVVFALAAASTAPGSPDRRSRPASHTLKSNFLRRFTLVLASDPKDFIGDGKTYVFSHRDGRGSAMLTQGHAPAIWLDFGNRRANGSIQLEPPPGKKLKPGFYPFASRAGFQDDGVPGLSIDMGSRGCNGLSGWFDVKLVDFGKKGQVKRLWATFEQHCETRFAGLYGEIRVGRGAGKLRSSVLPDRPWFLDTEMGTRSHDQSVYFVPLRRAARVRSFGLTGPHDGDFVVESDGCSGARVAARKRCRAVLRFAPRAGGPRSARLVVRAGRKRHTALLEAMAIPGRTSVTLDSEEGEALARGQDRTFSIAAGDEIGSWQNKTWGIGGFVYTSGDESWDFNWETYGGVDEGKTYEANGEHATGKGWAVMEIDNWNTSCTPGPGTFTGDLVGRRPNGLGIYHQISFHHTCEGYTGALDGVFGYRVPTGEIDPPRRVKDLRVRRDGRRARVTWAKSRSGDVSYYVVRYSNNSKAPRTPLRGYRGYVGKKTSARLRHLLRGAPLTVAVFPVDDAGNIGDAATKTLR